MYVTVAKSFTLYILRFISLFISASVYESINVCNSLCCEELMISREEEINAREIFQTRSRWGFFYSKKLHKTMMRGI